MEYLRDAVPQATLSVLGIEQFHAKTQAEQVDAILAGVRGTSPLFVPVRLKEPISVAFFGLLLRAADITESGVHGVSLEMLFCGCPSYKSPGE
jgi:hypothetical protein